MSWTWTLRARLLKHAPRSIRLPTFTKAACFLAVRSAMSADLPHNSGFTRPIRIFVPEGTVLNPRPPAAVAARALAAYRTANTVIGAFAKIIPERMMAADDGGNALITSAGKDGDGRDWVFTDIHLASWGGASGSRRS